MNTTGVIPRLFVGLAILALSGATPALSQSEYTFAEIVDSNDVYDYFHPPAINDNGDVAFFAFNDDGSAGIYKFDTAVTTIVDDTGDFSFFGGGMSLISVPAISNNGAVAFFAYRDYWEHGVYTGSGGAVTTIAESGTPPFTCAFSNPAINDSGLVAFQACVTGVGSAICTSTGGAPTVLVDDSGALGTLGDQVGVDNAGVVAFWAALDAGGEGMYTTSGGGTYSAIADTTGPFTSFGLPVDLNNSGTCSFFAYNAAWENGIYTGDGTTTTTIADMNTGFLGFAGEVAINDVGAIAYHGTTWGYRIGIFDGPDPNSDVVIAEGDALFGSTVISLEFMRFGLNDNGQIAFVYYLDDGRTGIAVATPGGGSVIGDLNGDCAVDLTDLGILLIDFGCTGAGCAGDVNGDDTTDLTDLGTLLIHFGETCP